MRRLAIMTSIIGAAAFAALLAWGLTFGSSVVQAQTPTPTPTEEATATAPAEFCDPVIPSTYTGTVTIDGQLAPDGTTITAIGSDGVTWATTTTSAGTYATEVPATMPVSPPCFLGGIITFQCDGVAAAEDSTQATGIPKTLDLTCGPLATPETTPTATVEPTLTPTVEPTPTVLPPTGMGGMSGDGSFMWWPLALAAAAITSVAGLFTARWARR